MHSIPTSPAGRSSPAVPTGRLLSRMEPATTFAILGPRPTSREGAVGDLPEGQGDGDPARRPAWSRTGATAPTPAAASADAGSLCVQNRGRGFAASLRPGRSAGRRGRDHGSRPAQVPGASRRGRPGPCWVGKGARPRRRDGRSPVPEAGGTGAEAVATPTAPSPVTTRTRPRNPRLRRAMIGGRQENIRQPAGWTGRPGGSRADSPNRERCRSGGFPGGSKGGGSTPRQSANVIHRVGWPRTSNGSKASAVDAREETAEGPSGRSSKTRSKVSRLDQRPEARRSWSALPAAGWPDPRSGEEVRAKRPPARNPAADVNHLATNEGSMA